MHAPTGQRRRAAAPHSRHPQPFLAPPVTAVTVPDGMRRIDPGAAVTRHLRRGGLTAAAALPQIGDGDAGFLRPNSLHLRERGGVWIIYDGPDYRRSTRTRDRDAAEIALALYAAQEEARLEGLVDVRHLPLAVIFHYYVEHFPAARAGARRDAVVRLRRLAPFIDGLRLADIDAVWAARVETTMRAQGWAGTTIDHSLECLCTAASRWCQDHARPWARPFARRPPTPCRTDVLNATAQAIALRWADGSEHYDPTTGTWSPAVLCAAEQHRRKMVGRLLRLGLITGTRASRLKGIAWRPNRRFGHIDIATATFFRAPIGAKVSNFKRARPVTLPGGLMEYVRRWRAEDGDESYLIRHRDGRPARSIENLFARAMDALGLAHVTLHVLRHTAITAMIAEGLSASVIATVVDISLRTMRSRYNHTDDRVVQPLAHTVLDRILLHGLRTLED